MKKNLLESKVNIILSGAVILLVLFFLFQAILSSSSIKTADAVVGAAASPDSAATADQVAAKYAETIAPTQPPETEKTTKATKPKATEASTKATEPTEKPTQATTAKPTEPTEEETIQWATVMTMETKCTYEEQWNAGYIVAIDYPDKVYQTFHVELTEEDRDVLEHLCMGEFGTGGFVGAALIAQCVKDAMCFDGYKTVEEVRIACRYDASLDNTPTQEVKDAVSYIFDEDHAAVQHRMMYMYNPNLVQSAFHESQNYVLTYQGVRFFDRWGY